MYKVHLRVSPGLGWVIVGIGDNHKEAYEDLMKEIGYWLVSDD